MNGEQIEAIIEAAVVIVVMNTNGKSPFNPIDADLRFAEISDSLAIGASIENMILKATELGLGTLWIANTCFAYEDMMRFIASPGQLERLRSVMQMKARIRDQGRI